jgi:hypothetical protein
MNRINQNTPQGSLTFNQTGTNPDGTPQYTSNQTYSPGQQQLYNTQTGVSNSLANLAQSNINNVAQAQSTPFSYAGMTPLQTGFNTGPIQNSYGTGGNVQSSLDFGNAPALPGSSDFGAQAQQVSDALYKQATSRLDPQFQTEQNQLESKLAGEGVSQNSAAYQRAMQQFNMAKTDAYNQANYSGIQAGGAEQSRLFGLALSARQQAVGEDTTQGQFANQAQAQANQQNLQQASFGNTAQQQSAAQAQANATFNNQARQQQIQEAAYLRNMPLNDVSALMGQAGGVQNPQFAQYAQSQQAPVNYAGLVETQYGQQEQTYQQQLAQQQSALGSVFGLAGSLGGAALLHSDRRLKARIQQIGKLANGIKTYVFRYIGDTTVRFGVMADEVLSVRPSAVLTDPSGYLMVDYGKVW